MSTKSLPKPIPVDASPRARFTMYAIGAAFRSLEPAGAYDALTDGHAFHFDMVTHVVRARNAGDAMRGFLSSPYAWPVGRWRDDERSQRLLFIIPVEQLMFSRPTAANIEVSTTHRRDDGAPIRYLLG